MNNYPWYRDWQKAYDGKGVTMIGIHTPESAGEAEIASVRKKAEENGLKFPIAIDNERTNWKRWDNRWWPSVYLIDKQGYVRYRWDGELNWKGAGGQTIMRRKIDELLREKG